MRASIGGSNKASASPGTAAPALRGPALRERGRDRELPDLLVVTSPIRLECVRVPAGEFLMGSALAQDREATKGEQPQHRCYLAEFYIGKYPVTNSQYAAFVELAGHGRSGTGGAGWCNQPDELERALRLPAEVRARSPE